MAIGDDAAAAGYPLVDGATTDANTIDTEINRTRDLLAQLKTRVDPLEAKIAAATPSGEVAGNGGKLVKFAPGGSIGVPTPSAPTSAANKGYVDAHVALQVEALLELVTALQTRVKALEDKPGSV